MYLKNISKQKINRSMENRSYTRTAMADMYGVDIKTFMGWCVKKEIVLEPGLIYPSKVKEIFEKLGEPPYPNGRPKRRKQG
jgi:hypothetical protein